MTSKISIQDGIKSFLEQMTPPENVLEGLYKSKLENYVQLRSVDQELNRDCVAPNCLNLRRMVRQHVDQTMGDTWNFRLRVLHKKSSVS